MVSSFEDIKAKAMADVKQELLDGASIEAGQQETVLSGEESKRGQTMPEKKKLMGIRRFMVPWN